MYTSESIQEHQRRKKTEGYGLPCTTLPDFAKSKGVTRSWIQSREKKVPLPKIRFESRKNRRSTRYFSIADLEKWFTEVNAK